MCKLFALTDVSKMSREDIERVLLVVNSNFRKSQSDGFGFALCAGTGRYVERYVEPSDFIGLGRLPGVIHEAGWLGKFAAFSEWEYSGALDQDTKFAGPMIVHGRTSTNDVNVANTHPFSKSGWTLAHNGVVDWHGPKLPLESTCDSEHLLNCYVHMDGAKSYAANLTGYFATLAISPEGRLHVAKCLRADLHFAWCGQWETYILTTDGSFLHELGRLMDLRLTRPLPLESYVEIIFDGNHQHKAESFPIPRTSASLASSASKAFGRSVTEAGAVPGVTSMKQLMLEQVRADSRVEELELDEDERREQLLIDLSAYGVETDPDIDPADVSTDELQEMLESIEACTSRDEQRLIVIQINDELSVYASEK